MTPENEPHWGKLFTTPHAVLERLYPRFAEFQDLTQQVDPKGKFSNAFVNRFLFGE
jgi:xylitol oxidase